MKKGKTIDDLKIEIPLKIRLQTTIQMYCLHEMGGHIFMTAYEDSEQYKEQVAKNTEIAKFSQPLIDMVLEDIDKWEKEKHPKYRVIKNKLCRFFY